MKLKICKKKSSILGIADLMVMIDFSSQIRDSAFTELGGSARITPDYHMQRLICSKAPQHSLNSPRACRRPAWHLGAHEEIVS